MRSSPAPGGTLRLAADTDIVFRDGFDGNNCSANQTRSCYDASPGTAGVGACRSGTQYCVDGQFGPCTGQVTPHLESCNSADDDCNGTPDDGIGTITCGVGACQQTVAACSAGTTPTCTPGTPVAETCDGIDNDCDGAIDEDGCSCVHVALTGSDVNPGTAANPMRTINAAIAKAASSGPPIVCVAAGAICLGTANYDEAVSMQNGVDVYGGYQATGTTWPRVAGCTTSIRAQNAVGVYFDASVTVPTLLDGFTISASTSQATSAAITVEGSTGAVINNDVIAGGNGTTSYGINVIDAAGIAATPAITHNTIAGGNGSALSVGVRALNSAPQLRLNCSTLDAEGRCTSTCGVASTPSIRARTSAGGTGTESYGILLDASPGTIVEQNAVCAAASNSPDTVGIHINGDATGSVIRANNISAQGGQQNAVGVRTGACAGAAPRIADNASIVARSPTAGAAVEGIRAMGACNPEIADNLRIAGSSEGDNVNAAAIHCGAQSGVASRCAVVQNVEIAGSLAGTPATSTGIRCDDGACALIRNNQLISARRGQVTTGVALGATGTFVDANVIEAGCASSDGVGLLADDSFARIQNNRISGTGPACAVPATSEAVRVLLGNDSNEVDLHSNDLFGGGVAAACASRGVTFGLDGSPPPGARGIVRNNIVSAGQCDQSYSIGELDALADPRVVENNDLWQANGAGSLYFDEGTSLLSTIGAVNALADIDASGNIAADPMLSGDHIGAASACRNAGTSAAAPNVDFEGDPRPLEGLFDIGLDEYKP